MSPTENQTSSAASESKTNDRKSPAKRIFSRVNDLLAIGIVLYGGLTMGDSVLDWWNTSPEDATQINKEKLADDLVPPDLLSEQSVRIEAGVLDIGFERVKLMGTPDEIGEQMVARLSDRAEAAGVPESEPTESELGMLQAIAEQKPVWTGNTGLSIYFQNAPLAAYVAVRENSDSTEIVSQNHDARVVSWGFVIPEGESRWTGWLFSPKGNSRRQISFDWKSILPEDANCELGFHSESEQVFLSFSGTGSLDRWRTEFEENLSQRNFALVQDWSRVGASASAEFLRTSESESQSLSLHIQTESDGRLRGLLNVARPREESP